jgi:hypothetical protein
VAAAAIPFDLPDGGSSAAAPRVTPSVSAVENNNIETNARAFTGQQLFEENGSADATSERHVALRGRLLGMMWVVFIEGADVLFSLGQPSSPVAKRLS